jgi:hypothetical protein
MVSARIELAIFNWQPQRYTAAYAFLRLSIEERMKKRQKLLTDEQRKLTEALLPKPRRQRYEGGRKLRRYKRH